jgi:hypothetical protein
VTSPLKHRIAARFDNAPCYRFTLGDPPTRQHDASSFPSDHHSAILAYPTCSSHQKSTFVFQSVHCQYLIELSFGDILVNCVNAAFDDVVSVVGPTTGSTFSVHQPGLHL